jgi:ABC-type glutathione transport system ATPase component
MVCSLNRVLRRLPYNRNRATTSFITLIRSASDGERAVKKIGTVALHNARSASKSASVPLGGQVTLNVAAGEFVALVGPSGFGKSTLMRIVAGIENADDGSISINSRNVTALRATERNVATVFQNYALHPHLTVRGNVAVPLAMRRLSALERLPLLGPIKTGFSYKRAAIAEAPTFDYWSVLPQARGTLKSLLIHPGLRLPAFLA